MTQKEVNNVKTTKNDSKIKQSSISGGEGKAKKTSKSTNKNIPEFMTRIVIRQLPPTMSEEQFLEEVSPLSEHTEFYFVNGDQSLGEFAFSRAYIKFNNIENVLLFKDKYDDYVFVDSKGNEFPAIVEYAPIQKLPRRFNFTNIKKDSKVNTIESDADFLSFKEELENVDNSNQMTAEQLLEEIEKKKKESKESDMQKTTPLVEYLNQKRLEKIKIKEDKKRKKEEIKKKKKDETQHHNKKEKDSSLRQKKETKQEDRNNRHHPKENKNKQEQERKIVLQNKSNNNSQTSNETTKKKDQNTTKSNTQPEKNPGSSSNNSNNINKRKDSNKTTTGSSAATANKEKKEKDLARIRNKDRPTREIYRPGMSSVVRQQQKSDTNQSQKEINNNHDQFAQEQHSKSEPDKNTSTKPTPVDNGGDQQQNTNNPRKQSQQPKYKPRVFTRTKN